MDRHSPSRSWAGAFQARQGRADDAERHRFHISSVLCLPITPIHQTRLLQNEWSGRLDLNQRPPRSKRGMHPLHHTLIWDTKSRLPPGRLVLTRRQSAGRSRPLRKGQLVVTNHAGTMAAIRRLSEAGRSPSDRPCRLRWRIVYITRGSSFTGGSLPRLLHKGYHSTVIIARPSGFRCIPYPPKVVDLRLFEPY